MRERFESRFNKTDGCWIWEASKTWDGYGRFYFNHRQHLAHRVAYEIYKGKIPDGLIICHKCDTPSCVNPDHLFLGTHKDNAQDMISKGRKFITEGETHPMHKLTWDKVKEIRQDTRTQKEIALTYGVSRSMIGMIKQNKFWRDHEH